MYFKSKRDSWLTILLWVTALSLIFFPAFLPDLGVWMVPNFFDYKWIRITASSTVGIVCLWIWFRTGYTIDGDALKIVFGPFKIKVEIQKIESIRETKNPFTAPALSMDKLEINYAPYKTVVISPEEKEIFISELLKQKAGIKIVES